MINEDTVSSADYKVGKDGRNYPAKRIKVSDDSLEEQAYPGNIGIMELVKFHKTANPEQKNKFSRLMRLKNRVKNTQAEKKVADKIWNHVQKVTNMKLHQMESVELPLVSEVAENQDYALSALAHRDINASFKDGKFHIHDHSQHAKAKAIIKRLGLDHPVVKADTVKRIRESLEERKLTPSELKKRELIARALERENPGIDMSKKMAIATAAAKKLSEEMVCELTAVDTSPKVGGPSKIVNKKNDFTKSLNQSSKSLHINATPPSIRYNREDVTMEEEKLVIPNLKPRNPTHHILAAKKNSAGKHVDKKRQLKMGKAKHKNNNLI